MWHPNVFKKTFFSQVLGNKITLSATTKALRCMRKVNGFDNYIMLTNPKRLDSVYGEYLRRVMLRKINDETFEVNFVFSTY